jgi:hypothetical protein
MIFVDVTTVSLSLNAQKYSVLADRLGSVFF